MSMHNMQKGWEVVEWRAWNDISSSPHQNGADEIIDDEQFGSDIFQKESDIILYPIFEALE